VAYSPGTKTAAKLDTLEITGGKEGRKDRRNEEKEME
jgi:hypothetical protein